MPMSLTPREREQVDAANAADGPAVLLLHEMWSLATAWEPWREPLARAGFAAVAVAWPHEPVSVEDARHHPDALAGVGLIDMLDHAADVARVLREPPLVVGTGVGGLTAQQLAGRGLARATVAIVPAPMRGARPAPDTVLTSASPILRDRDNRARAVTLTYPEFRYACANTLTPDEAHELWETQHVAAPGRVGFEVASQKREARAPAGVDTVSRDRGPLLVVAAGKDRLVPPESAAETFRIQSRNPCPTDYIEFFDRGHTLTVDGGWPEVARRVIEYLAHHGPA
ncbi:alpha/beta fold hydrolase [Demequina phytophila]|uniref:alpha/beta fold hydrolase n=1 Tax=Demequina phytophila TaxID=1638981 RepID=UPI000785BF6A|nr:alpha/beta hydrolase [Demequina phytophila]